MRALRQPLETFFFRLGLLLIPRLSRRAVVGISRLAGRMAYTFAVREKRIGPDDAIEILNEIAGAVDYAHRLGIIHRDIKPGNILLSEGHALLADFGIAQAVSSMGGS